MNLAAENIAVRLKDRDILESVSVAIEPGRITAIVGPNGAGKSTLLRALAGLQPCASGNVRLDGRAIGSLAATARARAVAYLPQDRQLNWPLSVRAVVALGRLPHRASPAAGESAADALAIDAAMQAMDVAAFAARPATELSGGERARVLFARALAQEAQILLADEPTAGLDPAHALELFAILVRLAAEGRSIAIALHDLSLAARFCHHAVIVAGGRVLASGTVADVLTAERLTAAFGVSMAVGRLADVPVVVPTGRA